MFCSVCGNNYDDNAAFCPTCGAANNSVALQATESASVDESTIGVFDSIPPVVPQPVEAPAEAVVSEAPVATAVEMAIPEAPVAPSPFVAPAVETPFAAPVAETPFVAPVAATPFAAPVTNQEAPKKKSKKPFIIGGVVAALVAAIVAVVVFVVVPLFNSPLVDISKAVRKTVFENSGMEYVMEVNGEERQRGAISIGDTAKDSGYYSIYKRYDDDSYYGSGLANYTMYSTYGGESEMPDGYFDEVNEELSSEGFDMDLEETLDGIFNNKLDEEKVKKLYNDNRGKLEDKIKDEKGEDVALPEWDEIQDFLADFAKKGLTEDALTIEKSKEDGNKVYSYKLDCEEFLDCLFNYAKDDERAEGVLQLLVLMNGLDDVDDLEEFISEAEGKIKGEIIINKDGYIVEFSVKFDGDEVVYKFKNINDTKVTLDTLKKVIEIDESYDDYYEDDYYEDDYYEDDYYDDDYYVDDEYDEGYYDVESEYGDYYSYDAWIDANTYGLYLEPGDTVEVLIECWGNELPDTFNFYADYPSGVSVSWGDWETDTSCYLYVTGEDYCGDYLTVTLQDEYGNVYDSIDIYVDVY